MKFIDLTNLKENLVAYKEKVVAPEILATAKNGVFSKNEEDGTVVTIEDKINELEQTAGNIVIEESTDDDTVLKSYVFKKNDEEIGTINIPKDLVVTSGEVVKIDIDEFSKTTLYGYYNGSMLVYSTKEGIEPGDIAYSLKGISEDISIFYKIGEFTEIEENSDSLSVNNNSDSHYWFYKTHGSTTWDSTGYLPVTSQAKQAEAPGTFIKLTIANQETPIFIDVRDLAPEAVDIQAETETIDWDSDING